MSFTYGADACVGVDNSAIHPLASPHTDCVGGYDALYDMSGNVAEWEDSCLANSGASDQCLDRGGQLPRRQQERRRHAFPAVQFQRSWQPQNGHECPQYAQLGDWISLLQ
ncbi:MAG TPA: hypothetical protein VHW01_16095 [Polyangiaceae bacterium]|nr:hypothetical protein [Polyangiaceae bacterium]